MFGGDSWVLSWHPETPRLLAKVDGHGIIGFPAPSAQQHGAEPLWLYAAETFPEFSLCFFLHTNHLGCRRDTGGNRWGWGWCISREARGQTKVTGQTKTTYLADGTSLHLPIMGLHVRLWKVGPYLVPQVWGLCQ